MSGAHEVVTTIMLNFIAVAIIAALVSGALKVPSSPQPITLDVGNAALPIFIGRNGHIGLIYALVMAVVYGWLLFRTTLGFEIRTTGANPDAARYAGMSPRRICRPDDVGGGPPGRPRRRDGAPGASAI